MSLLSFNEVCLGYGGPELLDNVSFQIEAGERLGLIGRNGSGKTSLLRLITGAQHPDAGTVNITPGVRIGYLPQEVPTSLGGTARAIALGGLGERGEHYLQYESLLASGAGEAALNTLHDRLDESGAWSAADEVDRLLSRMALAPDAPFDSLSAGMKRRVLLARELAAKPDLLVLDEPTNHLDTDAVEWLEAFLLNHAGALLFVTHDRRFLQNLSTSILDLDRGKIMRWNCDYEKFLLRKEAWLEAEAVANAEFDKKLAREEAWLRQGVKARRCRNEGRVRALQDLRRQRRARREQTGEMRATISEAARSGTKVILAENIAHSWDGRPLVRDLSLAVMRGDRIGLLGRNGMGKTTLLKILLGQLAPDQGRVQHGANLAIAYFDQLREQLDTTKTVAQNLAGDADHVIAGTARRHVISYLQDFLFTPDRARSPVSMLSGGERNRLLLAKLFLKPANVLVLDEPTNDLDIETLELLETLVADFDGTVLLVSHDRAFLDNVTTSYLVFEGDGNVREFVGDYETWKQERDTAQRNLEAARNPAPAPQPAPDASRAPTPKKLTFKETRELDELPARIETLEAEQATLAAKLGDSEFYRDYNAVCTVQARLKELETTLHTAYERWTELDSRKPK